MSEFHTVTVLGTGVLGSQIAFQTAYSGFDVVAYDIDEHALEAARQRLDGILVTYQKEVPESAGGKAREGRDRIRLSSDLADAVKDADLVIEAVPEVLDLKRDLYGRLGKVAPERTVFATNSSTLVPSQLKDATGRPDRFLALHFANHVWINNTAEVMGSPDTDPDVYRRVVEFAREIGMVPIEVKKENPGYVLNALLVPFLNAAADLVYRGVADVETIDLTWRKATGAPLGPMQIYDIVGLTTAYNISAASPDPGAQAWAHYLKENYIDKGKLGVATGEGFYKYPASGS